MAESCAWAMGGRVPLLAVANATAEKVRSNVRMAIGRKP